MIVTVITPTKYRPEAVALCRRWFREQNTVAEIQHIVEEGRTNRDNLRAALPQAKGDIVLIADDDDYYAPEWVERSIELSRQAPVFGQLFTRAYHIRRRAWGRTSPRGPTPGMLGFRTELLPEVQQMLEMDVPIKHIRFSHRCARAQGHWIVPIKGLYPTGKSRMQQYDPQVYPHQDPDLQELKEWIGERAALLYDRLCHENHRRNS